MNPEFRMSGIEDKADIRHIGADHQLSAPPPWYRGRWIMWTSLLFLLLLVAIVFLVIHKNDAKAAAAKAAQAAAKASVTATVATATKGDIGVYLDAIGTVTPVYTSSITAQADGVLTAVHYTRRAIGSEGGCADRHRSATLPGPVAAG